MYMMTERSRMLIKMMTSLDMVGCAGAWACPSFSARPTPGGPVSGAKNAFFTEATGALI